VQRTHARAAPAATREAPENEIKYIV
jgi:hypothetical protein